MLDLRRSERLRPKVRGEAAGDCPNPGRGWYRIYTFRLGESDEEGLRWLPFEPGERLAQLIVTPYVVAAFEETDTLSDTIRGEGGWGSTGSK